MEMKHPPIYFAGYCKFNGNSNHIIPLSNVPDRLLLMRLPDQETSAHSELLICYVLHL